MICEPQQSLRRVPALLEVKMNCRGMRIGGAKGQDAPALDGVGTLGEWLKVRGAVE
jgi:hypothetical protein